MSDTEQGRPTGPLFSAVREPDGYRTWIQLGVTHSGYRYSAHARCRLPPRVRRMHELYRHRRR
jgi:hypothetical protein